MKTRAIMPCCGYGTRMNMQPTESKELLLDETGKPIMEYCLTICKDNDLLPLVVTRPDKKDLIEYCRVNDVETLIIEPKGEWADTVLASNGLWHDDNILLLPDTRFEPISSIQLILANLEANAKTVWALHSVKDGSNWGILDYNDLTIKEKPKGIDRAIAWGIIGWKKDEGMKLFTDMSEKKQYVLDQASWVHLDSFKDITRTGKIE